MEFSFELLKNPPLPRRKDYKSTKKTKFHSQGEDANNPSQMTFKDKLMEDHPLVEEDLTSRKKVLDFDNGDVVIENEGSML